MSTGPISMVVGERKSKYRSCKKGVNRILGNSSVGSFTRAHFIEDCQSVKPRSWKFSCYIPLRDCLECVDCLNSDSIGRFCGSITQYHHVLSAHCQQSNSDHCSLSSYHEFVSKSCKADIQDVICQSL